MSKPFVLALTPTLLACILSPRWPGEGLKELAGVPVAFSTVTCSWAENNNLYFPKRSRIAKCINKKYALVYACLFDDLGLCIPLP